MDFGLFFLIQIENYSTTDVSDNLRYHEIKLRPAVYKFQHSFTVSFHFQESHSAVSCNEL